MKRVIVVPEVCKNAMAVWRSSVRFRGLMRKADENTQEISAKACEGF